MKMSNPIAPFCANADMICGPADPVALVALLGASACLATRGERGEAPLCAAGTSACLAMRN
jgi:hypothetical protein